MAVPSAYMQSTKNLRAIMDEIQQAQVPPKFTTEFLRTLGFTSSNDRSVLGVLKALGFLDQSGVPTDRYRRFRNKSDAGYVLAQALREAYSDLFLAREDAQNLPNDRVKGILATKVDKGETVLEKMATTFRVLAGMAKWDRGAEAPAPEKPKETDEKPSGVEVPPVPPPASADGAEARRTVPLEYAYNIQIQLPVTKDISVYNAIFRSIREHLL